MTTLNTAIAETISNYLAELLGQQPGGPTDLDKGLAADILSLPLMVDLLDELDQLRDSRRRVIAWGAMVNMPSGNRAALNEALVIPAGQDGE